MRAQAEERRKTRRAAPFRFRWLAISFPVVILVVSGLALYRTEGRLLPIVAKSHSDLTLNDLLKMTPQELAGVDVATMNLLCAAGLPGAENLDIPKCQRVLEGYASYVRNDTTKYLPMYYRDPARFQNMEGYFRVELMMTDIYEDFGIRYNSNRRNDEPAETFFHDSRDLFLNGLLLDPRTGTCGSLPAFVVALGQKLGYPLKLVPAHNHPFARWESVDRKERFNIECTSGGMVSHPDDYYTKGIFAYGPDRDGEGYLQSMTPQQEFADFLESRAMCLTVNKRFAEAAATLRECLTLKPESKVLAAKLNCTREEEQTGQLASTYQQTHKL